MLVNHLYEIIRKENELHPISQQDFEYWSSLHVTKRLFRDVDLMVLENVDKIGGSNLTECATSAAEHQALRRIRDMFLDWKPEELDNEA